MPRNRLNQLSWVFLFLILGLTGFPGCGKEKPKKRPPEKLKPVIQKLQLPASQLKGISLNGRDLGEVAILAPESANLDRDDLTQAFGIRDEKYLEGVMKILQGQIQSGSPLNLISVIFGAMPAEYAAQCAEPLPNGQCLIVPYAFNCADALPPKNWNLETYHQICRSLGRLKAYKPELSVALFDGDNTLWYQDVSNAGVKKGVAAKRIVWDKAKAELLSIYPPPEQREFYKQQKTPYDYYEELYKKVGALWNYNYAALAFRGLPLKEAFINFQEMVLEPYGPQPFPEMVDLLRYLQEQGIVTGVVSASPIFSVYPMVERLGAGIPLERIEGLDVFVVNPNVPGMLPVRLSRLVNQGKLFEGTGEVVPFKSYQEFLETYGDWIIVDVGQIINARGGKGVQGRSIARRHVAEHNRLTQKAEDKISIDQMRLVMVGGDNFAPSTDIPRPEGERVKAALEGGNDQGMSESLDFLEANANVPGGTDILFIRRYELDEKNQVWPKRGKLKNFQEYIEQQKLLRPKDVGLVMTQEAITNVKNPAAKGGFLRERPMAPETQPAAEAPAETVPMVPTAPGTPAAPGASPAAPGVPLPPVPTPDVMPPEQAVPPSAPAETGGPSVPALPPTTATPPSAPQLPPATDRPPPAITPPTPTTPEQLAPLPTNPSANDALQ